MPGDSSSEPHNLGDVLNEIGKADEGGRVTVGAILDIVAYRSLGVVLTVLGLIGSMPIVGALPGVSVGVPLASLLAIFGHLAGRRTFPIPRRLAGKSFDAERLEAGLSKLRKVTDHVDRLLAPRLRFLTRPRPARIALLAFAVVTCVVLVPLSAIPYAVTPGMYGLTLVGLALISNDGAVALAAYAMGAATVGVVLWILL